MSDIHVLVSPEAGRGRAAGTASEVLDRLRSLGGHVIDLSGADAAASAANARDAVAAGAERLVVLGGDGMVHLAVQAVAGTDTILGVVPVGTGNDFVRALPGVPEDPLEAAAVALGDPDPETMDAAELLAATTAAETTWRALGRATAGPSSAFHQLRALSPCPLSLRPGPTCDGFPAQVECP